MIVVAQKYDFPHFPGEVTKQEIVIPYHYQDILRQNVKNRVIKFATVVGLSLQRVVSPLHIKKVLQL